MNWKPINPAKPPKDRVLLYSPAILDSPAPKRRSGMPAYFRVDFYGHSPNRPATHYCELSEPVTPAQTREA